MNKNIILAIIILSNGNNSNANVFKSIALRHQNHPSIALNKALFESKRWCFYPNTYSNSYYAKATTDVGFKQLLDPSIDQKTAISFLNTFVPDLANDPIKKVEVAPLTIPALPRKGDSKLTFMNMHVVSESGAHFVIEMQALRHIMFDERSVFYLYNTYERQLSEKQLQNYSWYFNLKPTIAIQVLDYDTNRVRGLQEKEGITDTLPKRVSKNPMVDDESIKHFKLKDINSGQEIDYLQMIQIELPRYSKKDLYPPQADFSTRDWWFSILKHANKYKPEDFDLMKKSNIKLPDFIESAFNRLDLQKWNPAMQKENRIQGDYLDSYSMLIDVERKESKAEGKAEGKAEAKIEMILKCNAKKMNIQLISELSNISKAEILKIIKENS